VNKILVYWTFLSENCYTYSLCITLERYGRVKIEIKHMYPWFIALIKYGYSFWCV